ncbi:hypothetical protein [Pararobbsia silviterrae]|uniref:Aldose 1-epimerase n=1 Tax=Pararobbsia silviterrae TaxID=1792498 RepID=A0A494XSW9_9BURK|nr:hypothetical protein [Pararobbsia silviterrae]RKP53742.1 hypothetical protein D7S86_15910 [Pararobbsia silviterrae]
MSSAVAEARVTHITETYQFMEVDKDHRIERRADRSLLSADFEGWPAYRLREGDLELAIVPSVGGRLMNIEFRGTSISFVNANLKGRVARFDPVEWAGLCDAKWPFPLWGGSKTWIAPESEWPGGAPHRDLDSGAYRVVRTWCDVASMGIELESPVCSDSELQISRCIEVKAGSTTWRTLHRITNRGPRVRACGVWDVSMFRRPATVEIEVDAGFSSTHDVILPVEGHGHFADIHDTGIVSLRDRTASVACERPDTFKVGVAHASGTIQIAFAGRDGEVHQYRRIANVERDARYAHGAAVEIFNSQDLPYFEVESHSPLIDLQPGQHIEFEIVERFE